VTPVATPHANLAAARVRLQLVARGLNSPVALAWRAGDATRIYVAEQSGTVRIVSKGRIAATALRLTVSNDNERGLLGIAFSRDGKKLYVDHTDPTGDIRIAEYTMKGTIANAATRRLLLVIPHREFSNHNGGGLVVGPDNMLYIGVGDGGGGGDTLHNAQNTNSLLGKILRIDPRAQGKAQYRIPTGNPFRGKAGHRGEIWMYGLRNPWRFSFDSKTHDMWIGDVGQSAFEEVDLARAGVGGVNWGWNLREGFHPYNGGAKPVGARDPIFERSHDGGDCAIIGGYVYRGKPIAPLVGAYVFGDECTGVVRALVQSGGHVVQSAGLGLNVSELTTFGQGPTGGIFAVSRGGSIYVLAAA
jgi:glucose/arabinose dehydrogenase